MTWSDDELLSLSALQHILFCPRQCALIHVEQIWIENKYTAEGRIMHEKVDRGGEQARGKVRIEYGLHLKSNALGVTGRADVVEFHHRKGQNWQPYPVEYKRGKPKKDHSDEVQLCAQALCLEEMYGADLKEGALFYGKTRRRKTVVFDCDLRQITMDAAVSLHEMIKKRITPEPVYSSKCDACSFVDFCLPQVIGKQRSVKNYINRMLREP
jgi:CRISPR-associated exonuclease Cas4